jgi:methylphosphotriester-DNA--protein-cysteine methyltransferase
MAEIHERRRQEAERRVEEMKLLVVQRKLSCKEICWKLGVRPDSGERLFKRKTGKTLRQWQREHG